MVDSPHACAVSGESCVWAFSPNQIILFYTGGLAYISASWLVGNYLVLLIGNATNSQYALYRAPIINFQPFMGRSMPRPLSNYARGVPIHAQSPRFPAIKTPRIIL